MVQLMDITCQARYVTLFTQVMLSFYPLLMTQATHFTAWTLTILQTPLATYLLNKGSVRNLCFNPQPVELPRQSGQDTIKFLSPLLTTVQ